MRISIREELRNGTKRVGVWGLGYIGYSTMAFFAKNGVACLGTDPMEERIADVNAGRPSIPNLGMWLGFDTRPLATAGLMRATRDWRELISPDVAVHIVAVPTERNGRPFDEALRDVVGKLLTYRTIGEGSCPLVVIESTLTPRKVDELVVPMFETAGLVVGRDVWLGVAPRRDWFISPEKTLKTVPRVIGGTTPETTALMGEVLGIVSDKVLWARDHRHAEIVKSVENAYRQMDIALANQLSRAYPELDIREVLALVGTKWNVETYHPSFGTGGYCIPVAPQYVIEGARYPEELSLLHVAYESDQAQPAVVARSVMRRGIRRVGILGLSYRGDLRVHILSPTIRMLEEFRRLGVEVKVHDPYYTSEEIRACCDFPVGTFRFPEGLREFEAVLVVADHMQYRSCSTAELVKHLWDCRLVLDNVGIWSDVPWNGVEYHQAGDRGWLGDV